MIQLRKGLPALPEHMKSLPLDERGYPIPWFVHWNDGKPDFRIMDGDKFHTATIAGLCTICGKPLGRFKTFVGGPMNAIQMISGEPPMHRDCSLFAVQACPFLLLPLAQRRSKDMPTDVRPIGDEEDIFFTGNPGISSVWTCTRYTSSSTGRVFRFLDCTSLEWFTQGRIATQEEINEALLSARARLESILASQEPT